MADSTSRDTGTGTASPFDVTLSSQIDADAITADSDTVVGVVPVAGTVTKVAFYPNAAKSGADTDTRTLTLKNKGNSSHTVATFAMTSGHDMTADTELDFTLTVTPADLVLAIGDVLFFDSAHAGNGLTEPGGKLVVHVTPSLGQTP